MHVVLVDNILLNAAQDVTTIEREPHLGLLSLAAVVESLPGNTCTIFDPKTQLARGTLTLKRGFYDDAATLISQLEPDVVGFTALGCNFVCTVRIAQRLRQLSPGLPLLLGGPHATVTHRQVAEAFSCFDVVVRNEAETTLPAVLAAIHDRAFHGIAGTTFRSGRDIVVNADASLIADLDTLPRVDYGHYPIEELGLDSLPVEAGRGCPFRCTFCSTATYFGRRYRLKSAHRLVAELDALHERFGFSHFKLSHDLFTVNRRKILDFCAAVEGRGYKWRCSARVDCVDEELLERMAASGCDGMYFGIETGSVRMQRIAQKELDLALVEPTLTIANSRGIRATVSFITGYPQEESADQDDTLDLLGQCMTRPDEGLDQQLHMLTPEPGTALLSEFGNGLLYDGFISDFNFQTIEPDDEGLMRAWPGLFLTHHYYPTLIPREKNTFVVGMFKFIRYLGHPIIGYVLSHHEGRLSVFVDRLFNWHVEHRIVPANGLLVLSYLMDVLGKCHPVVSAVRHRYATERLWKGRSIVASSARAYVLHPHAGVLTGIHDCHAIHQALLAGAATLAVTCEAEKAGLHNFVIRANEQQGGLAQIEVTDTVAAMLQTLEQPNTVAGLLGRFAHASADVGHLDALVAQGFLLVVEPHTSRARAAALAMR